ncbi:MAG: hypothetical protein ACYSTL_01875 [Planctomycetota bacterium]|jgi:hypothetical protein
MDSHTNGDYHDLSDCPDLESCSTRTRGGPTTQTDESKKKTMLRNTTVSIEGDAFYINGQPTYAGRTYKGMKVEGLLLNARMVQGIFDDLNPETRHLWDYPDGPWDADRNTQGFVDAMDEWRRHGLAGFTLNLQGGSPYGYSKTQKWCNSAFAPGGDLRNDYFRRLGKILDKADELGMIVILGYFYFGQDQRVSDEQSVIRAVENATDWICKNGYSNVLVEICNESDMPQYQHDILRSDRVDELIRLVQRRSEGKVESPAGRLLVSASMSGGKMPPENLVAASDFILLHGNEVEQPDRIRQMVDRTRELPAYRGMPIVFNEDDHFDFEAAANNFLAAVSRYAGWGYFDYRMEGEGFDEGYQSVPCNWSISSERKRGFFALLEEITGSQGM